MKVGVTGANGFVGRHLLARLQDAGHSVTAYVRNPHQSHNLHSQRIVQIPDINGDMDVIAFAELLQGNDVLVHLAARVHVMDGSVSEQQFRHTNVEGTLRLFEAAQAASVDKFIFLSSVKAAAERSGDSAITPENAPGPEDAYGRSKRDAEDGLSTLAEGSDTKLVILRPAFVYGWPAVGNFKSVVSAVRKGLPLPLASIKNRRDITYIGNLVDAITTSCETGDLGPYPYFIADGEPVSTPQLFEMTAKSYNRSARLLPCPLWLLKALGALLGRSGAVARLTENFEVDIGPFRRDAGWSPPYNMSEGLRESAASHLSEDQNEV